MSREGRIRAVGSCRLNPTLRWFLFLVIFSVGCTAPTPSRLPEQMRLAASDGTVRDVAIEIEATRFTVLVFFTPDCPCVVAHERRLMELARIYEPRGVRFLMIHSELSADVDEDARIARERGYTFPLLTDSQASLARALNVQFATHTVVVDQSGRVRYSGAIDSDKVSLHENATPYLEEVLEDLMALRPPRHDATEPLGCTIELR